MSGVLVRIVGFAESAVDAFERALLRNASSAVATPPPAASPQRRGRRFRVLEVIEDSGVVSWVVSNGYDRATCNSAAFAERVKVSLG
jgi:hypothetical protein